VRHSDVTFASNQVRIRLPRDPRAAWAITRAVVALLGVGGANSQDASIEPVAASR